MVILDYFSFELITECYKDIFKPKMWQKLWRRRELGDVKMLFLRVKNEKSMSSKVLNKCVVQGMNYPRKAEDNGNDRKLQALEHIFRKNRLTSCCSVPATEYLARCPRKHEMRSDFVLLVQHFFKSQFFSQTKTNKSKKNKNSTKHQSKYHKFKLW